MMVSRLYCTVAMKMGHAFLFLDKCKESLIACCQHNLHNCSFPARHKFLKGIQFSKKQLQFSKIGFRAFLNCMSRPAVQLRNVQNNFKLHEWSDSQCVKVHLIGRFDNIDNNSVVHRLEKNSNTG
jgi:hypothetical protein